MSEIVTPLPKKKKRKLAPEYEVTIQSWLTNGQVVGTLDQKTFHLYGAIPGEKVRIHPLKKRKGIIQAALLDVLEPSPLRCPPKDAHFLSSSPYQIIPEEKQYQLKQEAAIQIFDEKGGSAPFQNVALTRSDQIWHYRNKMEFSFAENEEGALSLALHKRGYKNRFYALEQSSIAHQKINECARAVIQKLKEKNIDRINLKSLIIRYSYNENKCLAILYVKNEDFPTFQVKANTLVGWHIVYSNPLSPASIMTKILHKDGRDTLIEKINEQHLEYSFNSFFQANPPAFEKLMRWLKEKITSGNTLVDLYSGVGTIGLLFSNMFHQVNFVESDEHSAQLIHENAKRNGIQNYHVLSGASEKQDLESILKKADTLIVDPPRAGLHPKVIKKILKDGPRHFIYVSCNPNTQATDFALLRENYQVNFWQLFDLYPQTPHTESVLVMERKT